MTLSQRISENIRTKGILTTGKIVASYLLDYLFDWRYGTDTMRWMELDDLGVVGSNKEHGVRYQGTKVRPFMKLMRRLDLPVEGAFVDIGCGKGRTLLLASKFGFKRIVGVEFAAELCSIALGNKAIYETKTGRKTPIEIHQADATTYDFAGDETTFFFYNPFDEQLMSEVIGRISESLKKHPRRALLVYHAPAYPEIVEQFSAPDRKVNYSLGGSDFSVYHYEPGKSSFTTDAKKDELKHQILSAPEGIKQQHS